MADWDRDSTRLRENLVAILRRVRDDARSRHPPSIETPRQWHAAMMDGLDVPAPRLAGSYRGEPGGKNVEVRVGAYRGVPAAQVRRALVRFESTLRRTVARLDSLLPAGVEPSPDQIAAIIDLMAWVHSEWVRIHPFANGNGRTARIWANSIAMRYGLPPFVRLRPRPDDTYASVSARAMKGDWRPTSAFFMELFVSFLERGGNTA